MRAAVDRSGPPLKPEQPIIGQLDVFGAAPTKQVKHPVGGYAARPGTGPAGEKCRTCACAYQRGGRVRSYWKCSLVKVTGGPGTDIRLKSPACSQWRPKP